MTETYAFIGLGNLGGALAGSLLRHGFKVVVFDRDPEAARRLAERGAETAATPAEAASRAGNAVTCLPSPRVSEAVLAGANGLLESLPSGGTWIEMSTNGKAEMLRMAGLAADRGIDVIECPVTGGVHLAAEGRITALIGGDADLVARHRPAIDAMCARSFHLGPVGAAASLKVITNMLAFIHLVAAGEALALAKVEGIDLATAYHAIAASSGTSFVHETESQLILNGSYDIAFTMNLALKDLGFAMDIAQRHGTPLELAPHVKAIFEEASSRYGGDAWSTKVVKLLEDAAGISLRAPGFPARLGLTDQT